MSDLVLALRDALTGSGLSTLQVSDLTNIDHSDIDAVLLGSIPLIKPTLDELLSPTGFIYSNNRLLACSELYYEERLSLDTGLLLAQKVRTLSSDIWADQALLHVGMSYGDVQSDLEHWLLQEWTRLLEGDVADLVATLIGYSQRCRDMRKLNPLMGLVSAQEYRQIQSICEEQGAGVSWDPIEDAQARRTITAPRG